MGPTVLFTHLKIILLYCFLCINNSCKSHKRVKKKKKKTQTQTQTLFLNVALEVVWIGIIFQRLLFFF